MISERPWRFDWIYEGFADAEGNGLLCIEDDCVPSIRKEEDSDHIVACVNAIHAAGIQPADVAVFVKAVRAWKEYKQSKTMLEEVKRNSAFESAIKTAAALLPERKESK